MWQWLQQDISVDVTARCSRWPVSTRILVVPSGTVSASLPTYWNDAPVSSSVWAPITISHVIMCYVLGYFCGGQVRLSAISGFRNLSKAGNRSQNALLTDLAITLRRVL